MSRATGRTYALNAATRMYCTQTYQKMQPRVHRGKKVPVRESRPFGGNTSRGRCVGGDTREAFVLYHQDCALRTHPANQ